MLLDDLYGHAPATVSFNPEQRLQLFRALAPLCGPHIEAFQLSIEGFNVELGRTEVAALAQSLGRGLEALRLGYVTLTAGFWAAVDKALPSLHTLALEEQVTCSAADIGTFCRERTATGYFNLHLSPVWYQLCGGDEFQQGLRAQGLSHISVHKYET
jgi:hypothetical protein